MGEVYSARDTRLGREIAIKILPATSSPDALARFVQEARAASALNHPNIVTIYDIGEYERAPFIAMELVPGESLREELRRGALPVKRILRIASETASALAAAHAKAIVHRDLKPENLMVTPDGHVKVLDFGLAKIALPGEGATLGFTPGRTNPGMVVGTVGYMSPEQASGHVVDFRSDQFSLGTILYEMITGRRAFLRDNVVDTLSSILHDEPEPIEKAAPGTRIPTALRWVVERCLAKEPSERYGSTVDLHHDLARIQTHLSDLAAPDSRLSGGSSSAVEPLSSRSSTERLKSPPPSTADAIAKAEPSATWSQALASGSNRARFSQGARRLAGAALVALFAAVLGVLIGRATRGRPASEAPSIRYVTYSGADAQPTLSPDGRLLVFTSNRDGRARLWIKEVAGGTELALTHGEEDTLPRLAPDGASVLFVRSEAPNAGSSELVKSLYRVPVLGGEPRRIVSGVTAGDLSPDGRHVAFVRLVTENGRTASVLMRANADGGEAVELLRLPARALVNPRFSPDGSLLAATQYVTPGNTLGEIVLVPTAGGAPRKPPALPSTGRVAALAWAGEDELLIAQATSATLRTGSTRLLRQNIQTGAVEALFSVPMLTAVVDTNRSGLVALDGLASRQNLREIPLEPPLLASRRNPGRPAKTRTIFEGWENAQFKPFPDTGRWLTRGSCADRQPAFSPDGEWVVFSSNRNGNLDLFSTSTKTGAVRQLTADAADDWDPAFTPDGRHVIWSSNRSGHFEIWMSDADGSGSRRVSDDQADAENPTATRDGQWIVYSSFHPQKRGIWKVHPDGTGAVPIVANETNLPEVSPDGRLVAYLIDSAISKEVEIRVLRLADGQEIPFHGAIPKSFNNVGRLRWAPDGHAIAFVGPGPGGAGGIYIQDVDKDGRDTSATRRPIAGFDPDIPTESFAISPDGTRLVLSRVEDVNGVMLAEPVVRAGEGANRERSR